MAFIAPSKLNRSDSGMLYRVGLISTWMWEHQGKLVLLRRQLYDSVSHRRMRNEFTAKSLGCFPGTKPYRTNLSTILSTSADNLLNGTKTVWSLARRNFKVQIARSNPNMPRGLEITYLDTPLIMKTLLECCFSNLLITSYRSWFSWKQEKHLSDSVTKGIFQNNPIEMI